MQGWIIDFMNQFGYWGIALLIAVENIFPPIPSEVILTFGGFMTTYTNMNIWLVALFATIGSVAGAVILYYVGRLLTRERLEWLLNKFGRFLGFKKKDVKKSKEWFAKRGCLTVFFCRFIPVIRSLISIPAGMTHMGLGKFLFFTSLGTTIWNIVLIYLGALAGSNWGIIVKYMDDYSNIAFIAISIVVLVFIIRFFIKKKKNI